MTKKTLNNCDPAQFTGSENVYRHGLMLTILFTDGAKHIADAGAAYWLLDEIALAQRYQEQVRREEFQSWTLIVRSDRTATLTCNDGIDNIVFTKVITFTDFPLDEVTLWFENSTIYLPNER